MPQAVPEAHIPFAEVYIREPYSVNILGRIVVPRERVALYVDGFNLYHALDALGPNHLKWLNLRKLGRLLIKSRSQVLVSVCYFSAYAEHLKGTEKEGSIHRHRAYVAALEAKGVEFVKGNFARRELSYRGGRRYRAKWQKHEEKQTDVAIGVRVMADAIRDKFDTAMIVSNDTDMIPLFQAMAQIFPHKKALTISAPERPHHQTLIDVAAEHGRIRRSQVEKALFGPRIVQGGRIVARRPAEYAPP
ncbi:NYN domain-containing protein [Sandarakinorhabdus rubra]|uniref:NYN domain-containing protein n=1 Tax=Sandarakinorhabdus rubra TaxID=2672568 RepID=UPI0013DA233B|nr:NYN domain-containing protein [Sandarakinorhabdus rubra]